MENIISKNQKNDNIDDKYICPITRQIFKEPVICEDGYHYEEEAISRWFGLGKTVSPMSKLNISGLYFKDRQMKNEINDLIKNNPELINDQFKVIESYKHSDNIEKIKNLMNSELPLKELLKYREFDLLLIDNYETIYNFLNREDYEIIEHFINNIKDINIMINTNNNETVIVENDNNDISILEILTMVTPNNARYNEIFNMIKEKIDKKYFIEKIILNLLKHLNFNNINTIKSLINEKIYDINKNNYKYGNILMCLYCIHDIFSNAKFELINFFINSGIDLNYENHHGLNILHVVYFYSYKTEEITYILSKTDKKLREKKCKYFYNKNKKMEYQFTPIFMLIFNDRMDAELKAKLIDNN